MQMAIGVVRNVAIVWSPAIRDIVTPSIKLNTMGSFNIGTYTTYI